MKVLIYGGLLAVIGLALSSGEISLVLYASALVLKNFVPKVFGLDLTLLLYAFLLVHVAYRVFLRHRSLPKVPTSIIVTSLAFVVWSALSLLHTSSPIYGTSKLLRFAILDLPLIVLIPAMVRDQQGLKRLLRAYLYVVSVYALVSLVAMGYFLHLHPTVSPGQYFTVSRIGLGWLFAAAGMLATPLVAEARGWARVFWVANQFLNVAALWLLQQRGPLLVLIVGVLSMWAVWRYRRAHVRVPTESNAIFAPLIILVVFLNVWPRTARPLVTGGTTVADVGLPANSDDGYVPRGLIAADRYKVSYASGGKSVQARIRFLKRGLEAIREHPVYLVAGVGSGGFSYLWEGKDAAMAPHNILFELLLELGIPGVILWLGILAIPWYLGFRLLQKRWSPEITGYALLAVPLLAAVVGLFVGAQFSGDLASYRLLFMDLGTLLAVAIAGSSNQAPSV